MASEGRDEQRLAGRRATEWPSRRVTKVGTELSHHWTQPLHHPPLFSNTSGDAHCLPGQPIPMHHSPFGGETIPTTQPNPTQPPNAQLKAVASRLIATDPPSPPPPKKKFGAPFKRAQDPGTMRPRSTTATEGGKKDPRVEHPPPPGCRSPAGAGPGPLLSPSLPASLAAAQRLRCEAATAGSMDGGNGRGRGGWGGARRCPPPPLSTPPRGCRPSAAPPLPPARSRSHRRRHGAAPCRARTADRGGPGRGAGTLRAGL